MFVSVISKILREMENPQLDGDASNLDSNPTFQKVMSRVKSDLEVIYEEIEEEEEKKALKDEERRMLIQAQIQESANLGRRGFSSQEAGKY